MLDDLIFVYINDRMTLLEGLCLQFISEYGLHRTFSLFFRQTTTQLQHDTLKSNH